MKKLIKYLILTVCGVILFFVLNRAANAERPAASVGGEAVFLVLPVMWWVVERTVKDIWCEFKRMWREAKEERAARSGSDDSTKDEQKN